jgi:hypothetical protein
MTTAHTPGAPDTSKLVQLAARVTPELRQRLAGSRAR